MKPTQAEAYRAAILSEAANRGYRERGDFYELAALFAAYDRPGASAEALAIAKGH